MKLHEKISPFLVNTLMVIALLFVIGWLIITLQGLLVPVSLGIFLTFFLHPLSERFIHNKLPKWLSILLACIIVFGSVIIIIGTLGLLIKEFISILPQYQPVIGNNIVAFQEMVTRFTGMSADSQLTWFKNNIDVSSVAGNIVTNIISSMSRIGGVISLSFIFSVLFLLYRSRLKQALILWLPTDKQETSVNLIHAWGNVLPKYLTGLGVTIFLLAILNTIGFYLIGVPQFVFWGVITALLNIIPYVGTIIGFGGVVIFTLLTVGPVSAIYTVIMFLIIQFIDNNITTPMITGGQIQINPLAAIIGIIIGGNVWGIVGMIIALPVLGMIKITCDHIPALKPLGILISTEKL
jgi:predicted PurR-regulated permease PerM